MDIRSGASVRVATQDDLIDALEHATKRIDALEAALRTANEELIEIADNSLDGETAEWIDSVRAGIKDHLPATSQPTVS